MPSGVYERTPEMKTGKYIRTEECLKRIKETRVGMLGKKHSEETKRKMRELKKG